MSVTCDAACLVFCGSHESRPWGRHDAHPDWKRLARHAGISVRHPALPLAAQDVIRALGLPPGTSIGAFDALAAFNSPDATTAAVGRAVYTIEASLTNIVTLGAWLLVPGGSDLTRVGAIMHAVRHPKPDVLTDTPRLGPPPQVDSVHVYEGRLC